MISEISKASPGELRPEMAQTTAYKRLSMLFDDGIFTEIDAFAGSSGSVAEAAAGRGTVGGTPVFAYAQNSDIAGGAMSAAQAAKICKLYELALKTGTPVISIFDSIGGRLDEGTKLLAAYGDILKFSSNLSGVVPQISVVLGKCFGTQALIAAAGDIVIMSEKAELSLATNGSGASAEKNLSSGVAHIAAKDESDAIEKAKNIITLLPSNNLDFAGTPEFEPADASSDDKLAALLDGSSIVELQADFGKNVRTALGSIEGTTIGVVSLEGAELDGHGCSKAARFVRFCDAFSIPVITLVDAEGFGCIKAAARLTSAYAEATTAKITVITGKAYGAVYIAAAGTAAGTDLTFAWEGASISPLTPEAAAVIALGDDFGGKLAGAKDPVAERAKIVAEYAASELTAMKAAADGFVTDIISPAETRAKVAAAVEMLSDKRVSTLPKKHNNLFI